MTENKHFKRLVRAHAHKFGIPYIVALKYFRASEKAVKSIMQTPTGLQAQDVLNQSRRPTLLVLGSYYFSNPKEDFINPEADDILSEQRQREVQHLVTNLLRFEPTKVAVEVPVQMQDELDRRYQSYLSGNTGPGRSEIDQVAFRIAQHLKHERVHGIDTQQQLDGDKQTLEQEFNAFVEDHDLSGWMQTMARFGQDFIEEWNHIQENGTVSDLYRYLNAPEQLKHRGDYLMAMVAANGEYKGAGYVANWYERDLRIFVNLTRLASPEDRVFLLVGAGHAGPIADMAVESGFYQPIDVLDFL